MQEAVALRSGLSIGFLAIRRAMSPFKHFLFAASLSALVSPALAAPRDTIVSIRLPNVVEAGGVHNIHVDYHNVHDGELSIVYGDCGARSPSEAHHVVGKTHIGKHHLAKRHADWDDQRPTRFVWLAPEDMKTGGCLYAFAGDVLLGKSGMVNVAQRKTKRWTAAADVMDAMGPWFDGVEHLQEQEPDEVFVASAKSKTVGILGGGMSGLMTAHILDSVGFHNWQILEASGRIGGRVHTSYLNGSRPDQYQYQEMGPMRFPVSVTMDNETIQILDHRLVFQVADELNKQNGNNSAYKVDFIPWIQNSANAPSDTTKRRPDGTVPGITEVALDSSLAVDSNATYGNATAVAIAANLFESFSGLDLEKTKLYASNVFKAHKQAVAEGLLDFSESGYLRYKMNQDTNVTDSLDSVSDSGQIWPYDTVYFEASEWRTIDQGLSRLPAAFGPQVVNRTRFQAMVHSMAFNETTQKMTVNFADGLSTAATESAEYDYTVVAVPFSRVRLWRLPDYSNLLSRAITNLNYDPSCKVALHYKTRFWEHLEKPIVGGCGSGGGIPGIGSVCYPSYTPNATGPGVILASYISGDMAKSTGALTEADHVALVQRAMVEIHGPIADEQYTGAYDRKCWLDDKYQAGAWASPTALQQALYLPAYFHTEKHTVFVGEHTSFTHAWIWSALESAVRGTTQLLLDMGLVDEAKEVSEFWMARWISV